MASSSEANEDASADVIASPAASQEQHECKQEQRDEQEQEQVEQEEEEQQQQESDSQEPEQEQLQEQLQEQEPQSQSLPQPQEPEHEQYNTQQLATSPSLHNTSDNNQSHVVAAPPVATTAVETTTTSTPSLITAAAPYGHPNPAIVVAHHGLQVLQAASAAPPPPVTTNDMAQQYAQSAALLQMSESQFSTSLVNTSIPAPMTGTLASHHVSSHKVTRLRRACDMCSQRKVKCDESGPPCKPCSDLQVECTFRREMKRRGPPNKHAEAARAAKRHELDTGSAVMHTAAAEPLVSIATTDGPVALDAEAIAPWPVLQLLVDDFFTYIHPLMPFPHEPSFRQAFVNREDRTDREFLALLASMIGILVASFPRSARAHLKAQHSGGIFPTAITMIDHCRSVALEARGAMFMAKQDISVEDAAASYFLGLAAGYTLRPKLCRRFLAETMSFCRELIAHRPRDMTNSTGQMHDLTAAVDSAVNKPIDHIKDQISKRIFWVMIAGIRSMSQLGTSINELPLPPPTTQEPYPEQPVEVDDEYIYPHQILPQPEGTISLITGFNRNTRIYMTMNELVGVEMCYGLNFFDWNAQKNIIGNGLVSAKQTVEDLPPQLQISKPKSDQDDSVELDEAGLTYYPPTFPEAQIENDVRRILAQQPLRRRQLQCEIQKANIHASQLATRSYFVERYLNLRDAYLENAEEVKDDRDEMVAEERETVIQDLFAVLASIKQRNLEPNGQSIIGKARHIATTLVQGVPKRKGPVAHKAEESLNRFIDVLAKLERSGTTALVGAGTGTMGPQDEDEELQSWVSLREYRMQLVSSGGFPSDDL
ncbi:hypothetical protein GGS21DRAFT_524109 [Xylaria nigripes]|nr:hypothetical protein GGS21DRAFT_524109 [Xylaria nigripes]